MHYPHFQKYLGATEQKQKHKKQCLRQKNILLENEQLQIGCKIIPLYDFYSSTHYLQINLFIGNKTDRPMDSFQLDFRGTPNVELFVEDKTRTVKERTQYKERIVVGCKNYEEEVLILMDLQSPLVTMRSTPLPITLYNFCIFDKGESMPQQIQTEEDLQQLLEHKYEYIQEQEVVVTSPLFKKALPVEFEKHFGQLLKICEGVYLGTFTTRTLLQEYVVVLKVVDGRRVSICLGSNEYAVFDQLFTNFKWLLQ